MPHRRSALAARAAIEQSALHIFTSKGYQAASLDEVAASLGITRQAVLYHYGTKEHLLTALVAPVMEDLERALDEVDVDDPPTREQQRAALRAVVASMVAHREAVALITTLANESATLAAVPHLIDVNQRVAQALGGTAVEGCPVTRVRVLATMAALKGIMGSRLSVPLETEQELETLVDASLAMLAS
jgi:AcrR family transcriptional regulator